MSENCLECSRLRQERDDALRFHSKMLDGIYSGGNDHDTVVRMKLEHESQAAAGLRWAAVRAFEFHRVTHGQKEAEKFFLTCSPYQLRPKVEAQPDHPSLYSQHSIGTSMDGDCPECKRLSANFSEATQAYFAILVAVQLALDANNPALVSELEAPKLATQDERGNARQELRQHEATHPKASGQTA
jgi:hypothetical protein